MKRNIAIMLLSVTTIGLAVLYARVMINNRDETPLPQETNISGLKPAALVNDREVDELKKVVSHKDAEIETLQDQLAVARAQRPQPVSAPQSLNPTIKHAAELPADMQSIFEKMLTEGRMPLQHGETPMLTLKDKYASLIESLGLSDDAGNRLIDLIRENNSSPFAVSKGSKEEIRALLGADGYAAYEEYERTMPTRLFVDDLGVYLAEAGYPFTESQAEAMLKLNPETVSDIPLSYAPTSIIIANSPGNDLATLVNGEMDKSAVGFDETIQQAETILSPEQMNTMDQYLGERFQAKEAAASTAATILPGIINKDFRDALGSGDRLIGASVTVMPPVRIVVPASDGSLE